MTPGTDMSLTQTMRAGRERVPGRPRRNAAIRPSWRKLDAWLPYLLVVPILAFEGTFIIYPIIKGILTSFKSQELGSSGSLTTGNYRELAHDPIFWQVLRNTLEFTAIIVVLMLIVGLVIAGLLNWSFRGRNIVRGLLAIPWALPDIPTVLTFLLMMDPNFGVIDGILGHHLAWLTDPHLAFAAIVLICVWKGFPFYALITLSALQAVPEDLIEAAKVDGAGRIRRFWSVTLPGISPTLCLLAVLAFIYSLQQFSLIYLSTGGGPGESSTTLSILIYNQAFEFFNYSYASAIAVVGLILSIIGTVLFVFIERRLVRSRR
jgi:multiple sugar transport system permease protein